MGFKFQMGMGMKSLKWEGIGTKNLFPHTSTHNQVRRQVKICGVDRHGKLGAPAYNGGLEAERPPYPLPCKKSSDLYQFQERPLAKSGVEMSTAHNSLHP